MLALVMFLMGLTLDKRDFLRIREKPVIVFIGVLLQFSLMPLIAVILSYLLKLPNELTAGMVLVGSCAGGTWYCGTVVHAAGSANLMVVTAASRPVHTRGRTCTNMEGR